MKIKNIYPGILASLLFTSSFSLNASREESLDINVLPRTSLTFLQALERNYLPFDKETFILTFVNGMRAQKAGQFAEAIEYFKEAAIYEKELRPFIKIGECYAALDQWSEAFKWIVWGQQEAYLGKFSIKDQSLQSILNFLDKKEHQDNLRKELSTNNKLTKQYKKWKLDIINIRWETEFCRLKMYEPYLSDEEEQSKRKLFKTRQLASDLLKLQKYYRNEVKYSHDASDLLHQLKRVNTRNCWYMLGTIYFEKEEWCEAYKWAKKYYDFLGGREAFPTATNDTKKQLQIVSALLLLIYQNYNGIKGISTDEEIFKIYKDFAEFSPTPLFCLELGGCYEQGKGCSADLNLAFYWMQKSHKLEETALSFYNLGTYYLKGIGTPVDYTLAKTYLEKAAEMGEISANTNLAAMYLNGTGVKQDPSKAIELYRKAANENDSLAQDTLDNINLITNLFNPDISPCLQSIVDEIELKVQSGNIQNQVAFGMWCFYQKKEIKRGVALIEKSMENFKKSNIDREYTVRSIQNLITIWLNPNTKSEFSEAEINERVSYWQTLQESLFLEIEQGQKFYFKALNEFASKNYAVCLEYLNQAHLVGFNDENDLFPQVKKLLKQEKKDNEAKIKAEKELHKATKLQNKKKNRHYKIQELITKNLMSPQNSLPTTNKENQLTLFFADLDVEKRFAELNTPGSKIAECLLDIQEGNSWNTTGVGKPEVLKGFYNGYKGIISRRINDFDRLTYVTTGRGEITILGCDGHYDSKKRQ